MTKKISYETRVREIEHGSATRGMADEATIFYKRLASLLSNVGHILYCNYEMDEM